MLPGESSCPDGCFFVNRAFVAPYVWIISPVGPIPISLFVFELEAED